MSQEWGAQAPEMLSPIEGESVNLKTYGWYFKECEVHRSILTSIHVVVPVRPTEGACCNLTRMLSLWYGEGTSWSFLNDHMGGFIEATRSNIAYSFLKGQTEPYLLMVDSDMEPPLNLPYLLGRHGKDVVGAPAMSVDVKNGPQLCFTVKDTEGNYRFPTLRDGLKIPAKGLKEVGHVGTGALLISRKVLESFSFSVQCRCGYVLPYEKLEKCESIGEIAHIMECPQCRTVKHMHEDIPFFVPARYRLLGMRTGNLTLGEDIAFCNQVRAKGFKLYVDLEAHTGHRKTMALSWDEEFRDELMDPDSWVVPPSGKRIVSL